MNFANIVVKRVQDREVVYQSIPYTHHNIIISIESTNIGTKINFNLNYQIPPSWTIKENNLRFIKIFVKKVIDMLFENIKNNLEHPFQTIN